MHDNLTTAVTSSLLYYNHNTSRKKRRPIRWASVKTKQSNSYVNLLTIFRNSIMNIGGTAVVRRPF